MTSGFGVDPTKDVNGLITSGTASSDIRRVSAALYPPGVISGAVVTTSASDMSYNVGSGVVSIPMAVGETVVGPIDAGNVPTTAAPTGGGPRTDLIYATQGVPTIDGHSNIIVRAGTVLPARSVLLDSRIIPVGALNTNTSTKTGNITYSVPYGSSMGVLHQYRDTRNGIINNARTVVNTRTFYLPTDRIVQLFVNTSMSSNGAGRWEVAKYCTTAFDIMIDGLYRSHFQTPGLDATWVTCHFADTYTLSAGAHTIKFEMLRGSIGTGNPYAHYGSGWGGTLYTLMDVGPVA